MVTARKPQRIEPLCISTHGVGRCGSSAYLHHKPKMTTVVALTASPSFMPSDCGLLRGLVTIQVQIRVRFPFASGKTGYDVK